MTTTAWQEDGNVLKGAVAGIVLQEDEKKVAVPALGLSKKPAEYPAAVHAQALASHLVYGLTTDLVRRGLLRVL